jgi:hypothetical protein
MGPAETQRHEEEKLSEMKAAVAARLKRVCDGMDEESFSALVTQISQFKIKWGESLIYDNPPALGAWMFGREKGESQK